MHEQAHATCAAQSGGSECVDRIVARGRNWESPWYQPRGRRLNRISVWTDKMRCSPTLLARVVSVLRLGERKPSHTSRVCKSRDTLHRVVCSYTEPLASDRPGGVEAVVHAVRAWLEGDDVAGGGAPDTPEDVLLSVGRQVVLDVVFRVVPELGPQAASCHATPPICVSATISRSSCNGIQLGDPLQPTLFALALLHVSAVFLDGGLAAGDAPTVAAWRSALETRLVTIGLRLNRSKCVLIWRRMATHMPHGAEHPLFIDSTVMGSRCERCERQ